MKRDIFICILIVFIILITNHLTIRYSRNNMIKIEDRLEALKGKVTNNSEDINDHFTETLNNWKQASDIMAFYIEHDEIEKIDTSMTEIRTNLEIEEYNNAIVEIDKCKFILEHLRDKIVLKLKNIF